MNKDGKYRFALQFARDTVEQIRAGELLEWLGNKKSSIVVDALIKYMEIYPELECGNSKVEVKMSSAFDKDKAEKLIKTYHQTLSVFESI